MCAPGNVVRSARSVGVIVNRSPRLASLTTRIRRGARIARILAFTQFGSDHIQHIVHTQGEHAGRQLAGATWRRLQVATRYTTQPIRDHHVVGRGRWPWTEDSRWHGAVQADGWSAD